MAPKKKKKPAPNAARGFTTVSVPSKPRQGEDREDDRPDVEDSMTAPADPMTSAPHKKDAPAGSDIRDMLPDQLEEYLEDAEIQILLDSESTRCKSEAARQVTRLKAEIRQLRAQSMTLSTFGWLDTSILGQILTGSVTDLASPNSVAELFSNGDQQVLLRLWILQQVLSSLAFPRVDDALSHVVQIALTSSLKTDTGYTWGLSAALDWYALNIQLKELPLYQVPAGRELGEGFVYQPAAEKDGTSITSPIVPS